MDSSAFSNEKDTETETQETHEEKRRGKRKCVPGASGATSKAQPPKANKTRSLVWNHFTRTEENKDKCRCNHCNRIFGCETSKGTSNLQKHMQLSCKQFKVWEDSQSPEGKIISNDGSLKDAKVSETVFREATNEMLVLGELPLAFIESMAWRHFCKKVNLFKSHSRRTACRDIVQIYVKKKQALKSWIKGNKQRVSLTTDIWVAQPTCASYMVITLHFIDDSWQLRKLIIGFKHVMDHKGQTISSVLLECLAEWGIEKIFTITVDNATANTAALGRFQRDFRLVSNEALVLDGEFMHMRCTAHIMNLIVKEGLVELGASVESVRNAVAYVRSSSTRLKTFELKVDTGKMTRGSLPLDSKTRWNSTYLMLQRAIKFKMAFDRMEAEDKLYNDFFNEVENGRRRSGPPKREDWESVERLVRFLIIFYNATLVVSSSSSVASYKCYGEVVTIENFLISVSNSLDKKLAKKADDMRAKFGKYWDGMKNINKLLIIATVFDPTKKLQFGKMCFEKLYGKDSAEAKEMYHSVYTVLYSLFEEYSRRYKKEVTFSSSQSNHTSSSGHAVGDDIEKQDLVDDGVVLEYEKIECSYNEMVDEIIVEESSNELDIYLKETVENPKTMLGTEFDVLSWWKVNSGKYPILSEIAKDILAMQVSSVASESAFSTSGRVIDPYRSNLNHYMIEVLMCTQQWMKSEIKLSEKTFATNAEMLADVELQDTLEKEFGECE